MLKYTDNTYTSSEMIQLRLQVYIEKIRFRITVFYLQPPVNMLRILISILLLHLSYTTTKSAEGISYAKVSRNGQLARDSHNFSLWTTKTLKRNDTNMENENRSIKDIAITISPVYVSPRIPKLRKGEAVDNPLGSRYSTLDHELITKLDTAIKKKQIQQRFHPPAMFDNSETQANPLKSQNGMSMKSESSSKVNSSNFLGPIFPNTYGYHSPSEFLNDMPMSKPTISFEKYPSMSTDDKIPNAYKLRPNKHHQNEKDYPNFDIASLYENDDESTHLSKPMEFVNYHDHPSTFMEDSYQHDHDIHQDLIYDHIPEYHEHHKEHTTMEPEMNDQRLDKRPYSYYFIGKKLWYIPLYFSIYFIIYIAALVLKSIARHKINFPAHLAEVANHSKRSVPSTEWWNFAEKIFEGIEWFTETFDKVS